jgi:hypothetical protein
LTNPTGASASAGADAATISKTTSATGSSRTGSPYSTDVRKKHKDRIRSSSTTTTTKTNAHSTVSARNQPQLHHEVPSAPDDNNNRNNELQDVAQSRLYRKKKQQWTDVESMQVQLWDALRLARIVLMDPTIQTQQKRLTNHTILHAIRKVAEMKVQLIELQKQISDIDHNTNHNNKLFLESKSTKSSKTKSEKQVEREADLKGEHGATKTQQRSTTPAAVVTPSTTPPPQHQEQEEQELLAIRDEVDTSLRRLLFVDDDDDDDNNNDNNDNGDANLASLLKDSNSNNAVPRLAMSDTSSVVNVDDLDAIVSGDHHHLPSKGQVQVESKGSNQQQQPHQRTSNFEQILKGLYQRVDETSADTTAKIEALHEQLADAQVRQQESHEQTVSKLQQELRSKDEKLRINVETMSEVEKSQHHQIQDLEMKLEACRMALEKKDIDVAVWKDRCSELELFVLSPSTGAQQLLEKVISLKETSGDDVAALKSSSTSGLQEQRDSSDRIDNVRNEASILLSQMKDWNRQQKDMVEELSVHLEDVKGREYKRNEEVEFLRLQREMLLRDNDTARSTLQDELVSTRAHYEYEIASVLKEESRRMEEAEALEVELTHLAFANVGVEDAKKDLETKRTEWLKELSQVKEDSRTALVRLRAFHQKIQRNLGMQSVRLGLDVVTEEDDDSDGDDEGADGDDNNKKTSSEDSVSGKKDDRSGGNGGPQSFDSDTDSTGAMTVTSLAR